MVYKIYKFTVGLFRRVRDYSRVTIGRPKLLANKDRSKQRYIWQPS